MRAHGVTLAEEQFSLAQEKIAQLGLQDRVSVELIDYSALNRTFDKIASIGMFEHVAIRNQSAYFKTIERLLKPTGSICITRSRGLRRPATPRFAAGSRNIRR